MTAPVLRPTSRDHLEWKALHERVAHSAEYHADRAARLIPEAEALLARVDYLTTSPRPAAAPVAAGRRPAHVASGESRT